MSMDNRRSREFVFLLSTDRLAGASLSGLTIARQQMLWTSSSTAKERSMRVSRDSSMTKVDELRNLDDNFSIKR
jgi:hypothetical protein